MCDKRTLLATQMVPPASHEVVKGGQGLSKQWHKEVQKVCVRIRASAQGQAQNSTRATPPSFTQPALLPTPLLVALTSV